MSPVYEISLNLFLVGCLLIVVSLDSLLYLRALKSLRRLEERVGPLELDVLVLSHEAAVNRCELCSTRARQTRADLDL